MEISDVPITRLVWILGTVVLEQEDLLKAVCLFTVNLVAPERISGRQA